MNNKKLNFLNTTYNIISKYDIVRNKSDKKGARPVYYKLQNIAEILKGLNKWRDIPFQRSNDSILLRYQFLPI